jgi:hypothetical protein
MFNGLNNIVRKNYRKNSFQILNLSPQEFNPFNKIQTSIHPHPFGYIFNSLNIDNKDRKDSKWLK